MKEKVREESFDKFLNNPLPAHIAPSLSQLHIHSIPAYKHTQLSPIHIILALKENKSLLTSKLLFLAVESCNAFTQISATSATYIDGY